MSKEVHAEIEYFPKEDECHIHSDICPPKCSSDNLRDPEWRKLIHSALDEWIDNSEGTGIFYIKQAGYDPFGHRDTIKSLAGRLIRLKVEVGKMMIGSCICLTKSDDDVYHAPDCWYRKLKKLLSIIENKK